MAEFVVPLRKEIKGSLTRQGMQKRWGFIEKNWQRGEKRNFFTERAHKQVLTMKKNMHLILISSTGTLVAVAISTAPDGGFHRESMCSLAKPAHIPKNMLREVKVQVCDVASGGHPLPHTSV